MWLRSGKSYTLIEINTGKAPAEIRQEIKAERQQIQSSVFLVPWRKQPLPRNLGKSVFLLIESHSQQRQKTNVVLTDNDNRSWSVVWHDTYLNKNHSHHNRIVTIRSKATKAAWLVGLKVNVLLTDNQTPLEVSCDTTLVSQTTCQRSIVKTKKRSFHSNGCYWSPSSAITTTKAHYLPKKDGIWSAFASFVFYLGDVLMGLSGFCFLLVCNFLVTRRPIQPCL